MLVKIEDAKLCPECGVPMIPKFRTASGAQQAKWAEQQACKHEFAERNEGSPFRGDCLLCGYTVGGDGGYETCQVYQCPKCFALYRDEPEPIPATVVL